MIVNLADKDTRKRAEAAVWGFRKDTFTNPGMAERLYGSKDAMLRQYLNDCGFPGITETEAREVMHRIVPPFCADCGHPLEQKEEKALSGETALVWADGLGLWVCALTGNEHRPEGQAEPEPAPVPNIIGNIAPLTEILGLGTGYRVECRECGDVTREESVFTVHAGEATMQQAGLYRQRHLARHLSALATEVAEAAR
jgi:hypothetical protein